MQRCECDCKTFVPQRNSRVKVWDEWESDLSWEGTITEFRYIDKPRMGLKEKIAFVKLDTGGTFGYHDSMLHPVSCSCPNPATNVKNL